MIGRPGPRVRSLAARGPRAALCWVALYALWWAFVGSWSPWAAVWGAVLALVATVAALVGARRDVGCLPGLGEMLGDVGAAAWQVVIDFVVITGVLARAMLRGDRGPLGRFVVRGTDATGDQAVALRGWRALLATYSPNAWVVGTDEDTGQTLVHDLRVRRDSEEPV